MSFKIANNSDKVMLYLDNLSSDTIIFIDIDDTIITPMSKTFSMPPYNQLIDDIKKIKKNIQTTKRSLVIGDYNVKYSS